jgi:hypothetical protein
MMQSVHKCMYEGIRWTTAFLLSWYLGFCIRLHYLVILGVETVSLESFYFLAVAMHFLYSVNGVIEGSEF